MPFLLYVVELVCLVLHARVCEYHSMLLCFRSVCLPLVGPDGLVPTPVCTLYYHLVPRGAESERSVFVIW